MKPTPQRPFLQFLEPLDFGSEATTFVEFREFDATPGLGGHKNTGTTMVQFYTESYKGKHTLFWS